VQGQPTGTNVFSYTPLDQLSRAINTKGTGATVRSYHLDGQGNIIDVTNDLTLDLYVRDATLPEPADFQMDRYTVTPFNSQQYDHNGNLILMTPVAKNLASWVLSADNVFPKSNDLLSEGDSTPTQDPTTFCTKEETE